MTMNDLLPPQPEDKLEEALALLAAGIPLADILAEAGDDADWLRPLLKVASEVGELRTAMPLPNPDASLQRMLNYSRSLTAAAPPPKREANGWLTALTQLLGGGWLPRLAAGAVTGLVVVFLLGGTLVVLAQRSLPGHPLYALKRMGETVQLAGTQDTNAREQLRKNFNQRRQEETQLLLQAGETQKVTFEGKIEALMDNYLTLDGLAVELTPQTEIKGDLAIGARAILEVMTQPPDTLMALTITIIESAPPTPTPLPTATAISTHTPSPTATATATPGQSQTSDTINLPTRTSTPVPPSPTATSSPTPLPPPPTAIPTEDVAPPTSVPSVNENNNTNDNINDDNSNSNENDSGHDGNDNSDDKGGNDNSGSNSGSGGSDDKSGSSGGGDDKDRSGKDDKSGGDDD